MSRFRADDLLIWCLRGLAAIAGGIVLFIVIFVVSGALPALEHVGALPFLTQDTWHPTTGHYGLVPMLAGTLLVTLGSVLLAAPLGILSAIFCNYYAPRRIARLYRRLIELSAGVPSVIYGLWGLVVLVPLIGKLEPPGTSLLAGIAILALMILPTISLMADASIVGVPGEYVRGAMALGVTRWGMVRRLILPVAKSGILAGVFLAIARAIGETMAVLMVCGNVVQLPKSLFQPMRTLTANIALEMAYATGDHRSALFVSGLALILTIVLLVAAAEITRKGRIHG